jgi:hypothetical protein
MKLALMMQGIICEILNISSKEKMSQNFIKKCFHEERNNKQDKESWLKWKNPLKNPYTWLNTSQVKVMYLNEVYFLVIKTLLYEAALLRKAIKFDWNYKTNAKLSLCLIKRQAGKTYGGVEI